MNEELLTRVPPNSLEAEQSVLGAVLLDNRRLDEFMGWLPANAFYREAHREIYRAMIKLSEGLEPIDAVMLTEALRSAGLLEAVGGAAYIAELSNTVPTAAHAEHYARIVLDKSVLREIAATFTAIAAEAYDTPANAADFADAAAKRANEATDMSARAEVVDSGDLMRPTLAAIERAFEHPGEITGLATGLIDLDRLTSGLQPGDLTIVAARPSRGKTALGLNIAAHVAYELGQNVLFYSLEMSQAQVGLRLICTQARMNLLKVRAGTLGAQDFTLLATAASVISGAKGKLEINDESSLSPLAVKAIARREHRRNKLSLIVIDYIQLMSPTKNRDNREQEVADVSKSLKALAKELQVPVIALAQLNRNTETRRGRPALSDLRESGSIEQDADSVIFIHNPEAYKPDEERNRNAPLELILAKQRNGPTGTVKVTWLPECTKFENYSDREGY